MRSHLMVPLLVAASAIGCGATVSVQSPAETVALHARDELLPASSVQLNTSADGDTSSVEVVGLLQQELRSLERLDNRRRAEALAVYVVDSTTPDLPAIAGAVTAAGGALRFTPRFPLKSGLQYRAVVRRGLLTNDANAKVDDLVLEFATPAPPATPPSEVTQIYPSSDRLPENLLRFYIHFSAPMSRGEAYRHIHLRDADGREIEAAFLELGEELWDPDMRRFTLLCDPGRVKRGLRPREELGPVLEAGRDYALVIDADWPDAQGRALRGPARRASTCIRPTTCPSIRRPGGSTRRSRHRAMRSRCALGSRSIIRWRHDCSGSRTMLANGSRVRSNSATMNQTGNSSRIGLGRAAITSSSSIRRSKTWRATPWAALLTSTPSARSSGRSKRRPFRSASLWLPPGRIRSVRATRDEYSPNQREARGGPKNLARASTRYSVKFGSC